MTADQGPYPAEYPVQFAIEYPDRPLSRLTSFFRIFVIIPIAIVLGTVSGGTWQSAGSHSTMAYGGAAAGGLRNPREVRDPSSPRSHSSPANKSSSPVWKSRWRMEKSRSGKA